MHGRLSLSIIWTIALATNSVHSWWGAGLLVIWNTSIHICLHCWIIFSFLSFFGCTAHRILVPWPGTEPRPTPVNTLSWPLHLKRIPNLQFFDPSQLAYTQVHPMRPFSQFYLQLWPTSTDLLPWLWLSLTCTMCLSRKELVLLCKMNLLIHLYFTNGTTSH